MNKNSMQMGKYKWQTRKKAHLAGIIHSHFIMITN